MYVLLYLYTKHEHTKASSMPGKKQLLGYGFLQLNLLKVKLMKEEKYMLTK